VAAAEEEETDIEAATEETGGVESSEDLESFKMKSERTRDRLLFICSKICFLV
jgi:hypothetical protein